MEDNRLKAFCLVVELKSFSRAAEAKFMTQSAMSHLIKNLEEEIGIKLLNRSGKIVTATPAGRLFYEHAKRILDQYKTMESTVHTFMRTIKGPLYLGASTTAALYLLPQVFYSFSKTYPDVRIELTVSNTEKIINSLHERRIELGIVEGNIKNISLFSYEVAEDDIVIISSNDNPLAKKEVIAPHDLLSQTFIMPEAGSGIREFIDDFLAEAGIVHEKIKLSMILGSPELIIKMVQAGMGISFVSKWAVFQTLKDESIKVLNLSGKRLLRKFYILCAEKEPSTLAAKTFSKFMKGYKFFMPF